MDIAALSHNTILGKSECWPLHRDHGERAKTLDSAGSVNIAARTTMPTANLLLGWAVQEHGVNYRGDIQPATKHGTWQNQDGHTASAISEGQKR